MTKQEIILLAGKIVSGDATPDEIATYTQLLNSLHPVQQEWDGTLLGNKEQLEQEIREKIIKGIDKRPVRSIAWKRLAVAASILVMLGVAGYWWVLQRKDTPALPALSQEERLKQDLPAGVNGAVLTLADQQQIVLDSSGNGKLAQQSGMRIVKKGNEVSYVFEAPPGESAVAYNTMTTPRGRQFRLVLSDGTRVTLDAESSIRFPAAFKGNERRVEITGQAYFEVAHNAQKPFIVQKEEVAIQVLGTEFNVNAYADEPTIAVTLVRGAVQLLAGQQTARLKPGEQGNMHEGNIQPVKQVDTTQITAWKNGYFRFKATDIASIMRNVARWYDVDVEYKGTITQVFYGNIPRTVSAAELFRILEATGGVRFSIEGKKVIVMP